MEYQPDSQAGTNGGRFAPRNELSLVDMASVLLRHRKLLVFLPIILAAVLSITAYTRGRTYAASAEFVPQTGESSGGAAASLARQFGFDVGTSQPGQSPGFYVRLLRGRELLRNTVETEYAVPDDSGGVRRASLIELWEFEDTSLQPAWRTAMDHLLGQLDATIDGPTGVVELTVRSPYPEVAEQIATRMLELLNQFNLESRQSRAREEARFISERLQVVGEELRSAEEELEAFLRQNRQFQNSPDLLFEHDRLQRRLLMRQQVFSSLTQLHEQARIEGVRDTPVLTIVASPEDSAVPVARGTVVRGLLGLFLGGLLAILIAFIREFGRRGRAENADDFREFDRLKRETWADLRNPTRLFRRSTSTGSREPG